MKVVSVLAAQAFRIFRPFGSFGYLPDAVKKTTERFQFVDYPKEASQLFPTDSTQPLAFRHGKVSIGDRVIVIDWLQIYVAGIQVATQTNTTEALDRARLHCRLGNARIRTHIGASQTSGIFQPAQYSF